MDEQQKRVVVFLTKMIALKKDHLRILEIDITNMDRRRVKYQDEKIALSAAIEALTNEIAKWERT